MTKSNVTHNELREVWALVTERPGISLRAIASELNITLSKSNTTVKLLLKSGTLIKGKGLVGGTLRATVPLLTMPKQDQRKPKVFNTIVTFKNIVLGQEFVEVMTTCNEVARRIKPAIHKSKPVNARRVGGKFVFMADWEPVFIDQSRLFIYYLRSADVTL